MRIHVPLIAAFTIGVLLADLFVADLHGQPRLQAHELRRTETTIRLWMLSESDPIRGNERAIEAAGRAFNGQGRGPWDREQAIRRVETALAAHRFDLATRDERIHLGRPQPLPPKFDASLRSDARDSRTQATHFVDFLAAQIRLDAVREDILGKRNGEGVLRDAAQLTRDILRKQLQSAGVTDADDVSASFDWNHTATAITLPVPTKLWRLSGGSSAAVGRYFVCCDWRGWAVASAGIVRGFDASGLALPAGNRAEHLIAATLPAGTQVVIGVVADNFADKLGEPVRGGNTQVFVPGPVAGLQVEDFVAIQPAGNIRYLVPHEVAVWQNDRLLRFRPEKR
jgi:hypothetical protein